MSDTLKPISNAADFPFECVWINADTGLPFTGADWTGIVVEASIQDDDAERLRISSATGAIVINTTEGSTAFRIAKATMQGFSKGTYRLIHYFTLNGTAIDDDDEIIVPIVERF
jgi:hypothetical protein